MAMVTHCSLVLAACEAAPNPTTVASHEQGLAIVGTRSAGSKQMTGRLDAALLYQDAASACRAELRQPQQFGSDSPCPNGGPLDQAGCLGDQCMLQIGLCVGHKFMEIGDEVSAFRMTAGSVSYEIPPQSTENRTVAYRLASQAFAAAGERGVGAITSPTCMQLMMASSQQTDPRRNRAEIFAVGYGDAIQALTEATDKLVSNQIRAGDATGQEERDFAASRDFLWNAADNSRRAAVAAIAAADDPQNAAANVELAPCRTPLDVDPRQDAVDLLRTAAVSSTLNQAVDDAGMIEELREALSEDFPDIDHGGDGDEYLARFNLTAGDVHVARQYLQEEHEAFERTDRTTTDGRLAGLITPPAPLPAVAVLARTAGSRAQPTADVTSPEYRASGALQMLDYLRWGAHRALRQSADDPTLLAPNLRPLFAAAAQVAETETGHYRVQVTGSLVGSPGGIPCDGPCPPPPATLTVHVFGVEQEQSFKLVSSLDGLRCVTTGNIEGAACDPNDFVVSASPVFTPGLAQGQELNGTFRFDLATSTLPPGEPLFVIRQNSPVDEVAGFVPDAARSPDGAFAGVLITPGGGAIQRQLPEIVGRSPDSCGVPATACADLPADLIVPLESEITEDNDPYENSWRHYLDLADRMSREADALGEELIGAGLELDQRGEAARDELEAICGGVVNVPDAFSGDPLDADDGDGCPAGLPIGLDPALQACLHPPIETWVTLGDEDLCAWRHVDSGAPCVCPASLRDGEGDDDLASCTGRCPTPKDPEGGACTLPADMPADQFVVVPEDGPGGCPDDPPPRIRRLRLLPAPATSVRGVNCPLLHGLRVNDYLPALRQAIVDEAARSWMNPRVLRQLVSSAEYDEDWRDDLELGVLGSGVMSTRLDAHLPPCADPAGGDEQRRAALDLFPLEDICGEEDAERQGRREWIHHVRRAFGTLGLIAGALDGNMTRSVVLGLPGDCQPLLDDPSEQLCSPCGPFEGGCACLTDGADFFTIRDYGDAGCGAFKRRDHTIELANTNIVNYSLNRLWGVSDPIGDDDTIRGVLQARPRGSHFSYLWERLFVMPGEDDADFGIFHQIAPGDPDAGRPADTVGSVTEDLGSLTDTDIYDALDLACYLAFTQGGGCETFNPTTVPVIDEPDDLKGLEQHLHCAADGILTSAGRALLASVPSVIVDSIGSGQPLSLYPGYRGEMLDAMVALQSDVELVASQVNAIQSLVRRAAYATSLARQRLDIERVEAEITQLQSIAQLLSTVTNALAGAFGSFGTSTADLPFQIAINREVADLQGELAAQEQGLILADFAQEAGDVADELTSVGLELRQTVFRLNADLGRLEALRSRAQSAAARSAFADSDASGRLFPVTTVMRRRYNTLRLRYERARDRARKMAFIARRAIEQRFGLSLIELDRDLTLVESPATWADDVCDFEGIDYARIREKQAEQGVAEDDRVPDNFVDGYLGDYVEKLRLFVESYPFDFPFQDGGDLAVLSLRDDIFRTRVQCEVGVPNLLASSDRVAGGEGPAGEGPWLVEGCLVDEGGVPDPCIVLETRSGIDPSVNVNLVADAQTDPPVAPSGRVSQEVDIAEVPADLLLSWKARLLDVTGLDTLAPYRVTIERVDGAGAPASSTFSWAGYQEGEIRAEQLEPFAVIEPGRIRVTFEPSEGDEAPGRVWLSELQLEALGPGEEPTPSAYMRTTRAGYSILQVCPDVDGEVLRGDDYFHDREETICAAGVGRDCAPGDVIATQRFHEAVFALDLVGIERGELIPSAAIALGNYNYRHDLVAVNLVGTNVRDCTDSEEPATCYANAFIPLTLIHEGDVEVRNHDGQRYDFRLERAFIEHGKALASEVVLTNPLSSSAETMLGPYYKQEFRGRPLMGRYTLRIWDDPALNWQNVEDVQLVFRYRYWTRFER
jgi:hypothetical protein